MLDRVTPEELEAQYARNDWEREPAYLAMAADTIRELQEQVRYLTLELYDARELLAEYQDRCW